MDLSLYWTVWIALSCFAIAELGRRFGTGAAARGWAWQVSATGLAILVIHVVIAMGARHGWSHDAAWIATARQTADVYGFAWGGGVYFNYLFVVVWLLDVWQSRRGADLDSIRPPAATAIMRVFYLVIVANAAVVFAGGLRRVGGAVITAALLVCWWPARPR